jgi:hypothetical protein
MKIAVVTGEHEADYQHRGHDALRGRTFPARHTRL